MKFTEMMGTVNNLETVLHKSSDLHLKITFAINRSFKEELVNFTVL